ncbi:MAG: TauD/TfdA family dioxygenase [Actinomycetia bacterium]|nr:TauD/TfdA family dioxygenase [Actinomycetes bacterium]MCP5035011.1 TauD/TfdA family dioxygenase [Actinomycetes bacterium]
MSANTLDLEPLNSTFGAIVNGVELRSIDDETFTAIHEAWLQYGLLVFPGQFLTKDEQNDFARRFGDLEFPAAPISNVTTDGVVHSDPDEDLVKSLRGNEGWHFDSTYMPIQAKGAVFSAEVVPSSGAATGFVDMRVAYQALDDETKEKIQDLSAYHSLYYSQGRVGYLPTKKDDGTYGQYGYHDFETSLRPLVRIDPVNGLPNLLTGRHAHNIVGMDSQESETLLDWLADHACTPERMYHHQWTVGDAIVWDNRWLMHQATPFDMTEPRIMWHTRIAGEPETESATNHMPQPD